MTRDEYAQAPLRAAYYWSVEKNGLVVAEEFSTSGVDTPLATAGLVLEDSHFKNNHEESVRVHAKPYREAFPAFFLDIGPQESLIWKHLVKQIMGMFGQSHSEPTEYLIFGRKSHDGQEFVIVVDWLGNYARFDSEQAALTALT